MGLGKYNEAVTGCVYWIAIIAGNCSIRGKCIWRYRVLYYTIEWNWRS